jgi:hypothetical protein
MKFFSQITITELRWSLCLAMACADESPSAYKVGGAWSFTYTNTLAQAKTNGGPDRHAGGRGQDTLKPYTLDFRFCRPVRRRGFADATEGRRAAQFRQCSGNRGESGPDKTTKIAFICSRCLATPRRSVGIHDRNAPGHYSQDSMRRPATHGPSAAAGVHSPLFAEQDRHAVEDRPLF